MPPPGTPDYEQDKCVHVDLAAPDLPWRYAPTLANGRQLRPWIVLVVGTADTVALQANHTVTLSGSAITAHDLSRSSRWAHVQEDADQPGTLISRLVCERQLDPLTAYVAVVVPAFTVLGQPAWSNATTSVDPAGVLLVAVLHRRGRRLRCACRTAEAGAGLGGAGPGADGIPAGAERGAAPVAWGPCTDRIERCRRRHRRRRRRHLAHDHAGSTRAGRSIGLPAYGACWVADPEAPRGAAASTPIPPAAGPPGSGHGRASCNRTSSPMLPQPRRVRWTSPRSGSGSCLLGLAAARSLWARRTPTDRRAPDEPVRSGAAPDGHLDRLGPRHGRRRRSAARVRAVHRRGEAGAAVRSCPYRRRRCGRHRPSRADHGRQHGSAAAGPLARSTAPHRSDGEGAARPSARPRHRCRRTRQTSARRRPRRPRSAFRPQRVLPRAGAALQRRGDLCHHAGAHRCARPLLRPARRPRSTRWRPPHRRRATGCADQAGRCEQPRQPGRSAPARRRAAHQPAGATVRADRCRRRRRLHRRRRRPDRRPAGRRRPGARRRSPG